MKEIKLKMKILESIKGIGPDLLKISNNTPFEVTIDEWSIIKSYANQIIKIGSEAEENIKAFISSFQILKKCAVKWEESIFLNIIKLSDYLYKFGMETVKVEYCKLKDILCSVQGMKPSEHDRLLFHKAILNCINEIENIINLSSIVIEDLIDFSNSIENTYRECQQYMYIRANDWIINIDSNSKMKNACGMDIVQQTIQAVVELSLLMIKIHTPPLADIQRFRGVWASIREDLDYIDLIFNKEIQIDEPFIVSINISVAISEWERVAMEAYDFSNKAKLL